MKTMCFLKIIISNKIDYSWENSIFFLKKYFVPFFIVIIVNIYAFRNP